MKNLMTICAVCLYLAAVVLFVLSVFSENRSLYMGFGAACTCFGALITIYAAKRK